MCRNWFKVSGAVMLLTAMTASSGFAQEFAAGYLHAYGWNQLGPLGNPNGAAPPPSVMLQQWLCPQDLSDVDFNPDGFSFDAQEIDFGCSPSNGHAYGNLALDGNPVWYTIQSFEGAFASAAPIPLWEDGEGVNFQQQVDHLNGVGEVTDVVGGTLPGDNVMYVCTSYIENDSGSAQPLSICASSDDSIQVWINNLLVLNWSQPRGSGGRGGCQNVVPVIVAPGVSKITVAVWEGGGGHNFRLAFLDPSGSKLGEENDQGITYLGAGEGDLSGNGQFGVTASLVGGDFNCNTAGSLVLQGSGAGDGETAVSITQELRITGAEITNISNDGVAEDIVEPDDGIGSTGANLVFHVLGPIANPGGSNPGPEAMRADFTSVSDAALCELNEGDELDGLTVRRLGINNGDGLDYNQVGGGGDNIMHYAWTKLVLTESKSIVVAGGSDDAITFLLKRDGEDELEELSIFSGGRGWGGAGSIQDFTVSCIVELEAGTHTILSKTFEGGGGHGVRMLILEAPESAAGAGSPDPAEPTEIAVGQVGVGCTLNDAAATAGVVGTESSRAHYYVVEGTGNDVTASTCGRFMYDTWMGVFTGDPAAPAVIAAVDDNCGRQQSITFATEAGESYVIQVNGWANREGPYRLSVSDTKTSAPAVDFGALRGDGLCADPDGDCDPDANLVVGNRITWNTTIADVNDGLSVEFTVAGADGGRVDAPGGAPVTAGDEVVAVVAGGGSLALSAATGPIGPFDDSLFIDRGVAFPRLLATPTGEQAGGLDVYRAGAGGRDIWGGADEMTYAYKAVTGDFDAKIRIVAVDEPNDGDGHRWGRYGLMARQSCANNSANQFLYHASGSPNPPEAGQEVFQQVDPLSHQWRDCNGCGTGRIDFGNDGQSSAARLGAEQTGIRQIDSRPAFLRMIRVGNTFSTLCAFEDEATGEPIEWIRLTSRTIPSTPESILVGFAIGGHGTAGGGNTLITADFTFEVSEFVPPEYSCPGGRELGDVVLEDSLDDTSGLASIGVRAGGFRPDVVDGRLRLTEQNIGGSATAAYYHVDEDINSGLRFEVDVFMTRDGVRDDPNANPADGMTVTFISGGFQDGSLTALPESVDGSTDLTGSDLDTAEFVGDDEGGRSDSGYDEATGVYGIISSSDKDIWTGGDDFQFQYTVVEGDFDIAISWDPDEDGEQNTAGGGRWGKTGIMARYLDVDGNNTRCSGFMQVQGHINLEDAARAAGRRVDGNCGGGMYEVGNGSVNRFPTYARMVRRGNLVYHFASDNAGLANGDLDSLNPPCWTLIHVENRGDLPESLAVGVAASKHDNGADDETGDFAGEFRLLELSSDGASCIAGATRIGDGGGALAYAGGSMFPSNTRSPSMAVEIDNWVGGGNNEPGDGGSPNFDGNYHFGLDQGGLVDSEQTSSDLGVGPDELPDIYDPAGIHVTIDYTPDGQVNVWAKSNADGEGEGGDDLGIQVLSTRVLPLLDGPFVFGFNGGTGGATTTQEVDNVKITKFNCIQGFFKKPMDWNADGNADLSDAVAGLNHLFLGGVEHPCGPITNAGTLALMDSNDDGQFDLSDNVGLLSFLFLGGPMPAPLSNAAANGCLLVVDCADTSSNCP